MDPNNTPSRARARTEEGRRYIPFNANPAAVGTRSGKPMPSDVRRDSETGYENISDFFDSPEGTTTRSTATSARRTTYSGSSRRTGVDPRSEQEDGDISRGNGTMGEMTMDIETPTRPRGVNGAYTSPSSRLRIVNNPATIQDDEAIDYDRPPPLNLPSASRRRIAESSRRAAARDEDFQNNGDEAELDDEDDDEDDVGTGINAVSSSRRKSINAGTSQRSGPRSDEVFGQPDLHSEGNRDTGDQGYDDFGPIDDGGDLGGDLGAQSEEDNEFADALDVDQAIEMAFEEEEPEEEEEEEEEEAPRTTTAKSKGKAKAKGKAGKVLSDKTNKRKTVYGSDSEGGRAPAPKRNRMREVSVDPIRRPADEDTKSYLRTARERRPPLEYWRGERPVYTRRKDENGNLEPAYVVEEWLEVPKQEPQPLAARNKPAGKKGRGRSASVKPKMSRISEEAEEEDFSSWDNGTEPSGVTRDYETGQDIIRKVACTGKQVRPKAVLNATFEYEKIFGEEDFFAAGIFRLEINGEKLPKNAKDNVYVFYVDKGCVEVTIHRTKFVMAQGGQFIVPRGNTYSIKNISPVPVALFFAQARRILMDGDAPQKGGEGQVPETSAGPSKTKTKAKAKAPTVAPDEDDDEDDEDEDEDERPAPRKRGKAAAGTANRR